MPSKNSRNDKIKTLPKSVSSLSPKKQRHAVSWGRGQARKQLRREKQEAAAARNRGLRARGELTPWEQAKSAAKYRKGPGANLTEADKALHAEAVAEGRVPVRKLTRVDLSAKPSAAAAAAEIPVEKNGSNISSKRVAIREAKRKGTGNGD